MLRLIAANTRLARLLLLGGLLGYGGPAQATLLGRNGRTAGSPAWSPDGARIAYVSNVRGDLELWVMAADGSGQHPLTSDPGFVHFEPSWSPDGRRIVFASNVRGDVRLYTINPAGSDRRLVFDDQQRLPAELGHLPAPTRRDRPAAAHPSGLPAQRHPPLRQRVTGSSSSATGAPGPVLQRLVRHAPLARSPASPGRAARRGPVSERAPAGDAHRPPPRAGGGPSRGVTATRWRCGRLAPFALSRTWEVGPL